MSKQPQKRPLARNPVKLLTEVQRVTRPLLRSTKALTVFAVILALAIAWMGFQLVNHRHTGILWALAGAKHFLIRATARGDVQPRQGSIPPGPQHSVTLSWKASTSAGVAYNVYRRGRSGIVRINAVPLAATSCVDDTVQAGETYFYTTKAVSAKGTESLPSNEVRVTVPSP